MAHIWFFSSYGHGHTDNRRQTKDSIAQGVPPVITARPPNNKRSTLCLQRRSVADPGKWGWQMAEQWRNDGVAAASRDGGPTGKGALDSSKVLND